MKLDIKTFQKIMWQKRMKHVQPHPRNKLSVSLRYVKNAAQTAVLRVDKVCHDIVCYKSSYL